MKSKIEKQNMSATNLEERIQNSILYFTPTMHTLTTNTSTNKYT